MPENQSVGRQKLRRFVATALLPLLWALTLLIMSLASENLVIGYRMAAFKTCCFRFGSTTAGRPPLIFSQKQPRL